MKKLFQKNIEDFVCNNCDFFVKGSGYTNHCPKCLWSKHVDINPGDRLEKCKGMMEPVYIEKGSEGYDIIHECQKCHKKQRNKAAKDDDFEVILGISKKAQEKQVL